MKPITKLYHSYGGAKIYRIPLHLFPELWGYVHLVLVQDLVLLVDVGSGFGDANEHLELGLQRLAADFGEAIGWSDITHILITHAHIDHFGGLPYVRERTRAALGVHELDRRVLIRYEDRVATVAHRLNAYLKGAGVERAERTDLMDLYLLNKQLFSSRTVDFTFGAMGMQLGPVQFIHTPGHTPGHVVLLLDDVMLAGDHLLEKISPHLAPESLTLNTGLGHYLSSLEALRPYDSRVGLMLGGHEGPFKGLARRIDEIKQLYRQRLEQVLDLAGRPRTINELAGELFGEAKGYHRLLALEEAGAYVEYLVQLGHLGLEDFNQLDQETDVPVRYRKVDDLGHPLVGFDPAAMGPPANWTG